MKRTSIICLALVVATLVGYTSAQALPIQVGDVFAAVDGGGNVQQWRGGALIDTLNTGSGFYTTGMAFDKAGNLYVTNFNNTVSKFDTNGTLVTSSFITAGFALESILFDKAQNVWVGDAGSTSIRQFSSSGGSIPLNTYTVASEARGTDWIDLAADQTTMYYTSEGSHLKAFDTATNTQLADVTNQLTGGASYALRLVGDGTVLVANTADIKRISLATGAVLQTYDAAGQNSWFALNLDPDGKSFWSGDFGTDDFFKFDIASGALLGSFDTGFGGNHMFGLAVSGEITQSGGGNTQVPEPATMLLFGVGLAGISILRKRIS